MSAWGGQGRAIHVQEVALRDGLQSEAGFVPTGKKSNSSTNSPPAG